MSSLSIKDGQFWLDNQPMLVQAGEFHYFRTPRDQWRHRLELLKSAGFNTLATYIPWLWHQLEEGKSDFDGHSHPMRDLAGFLDLAAEMGLLIIARPGPYIMAETINEGVPPWVFEKYPQTAFIDQEGKIQNIVSYLHPDFLACVSQWYQSIFQVLTPRQITRAGRIIMVQLDNEMGMIHWVRNIQDTNPDTIGRFAAWLERTHADRLLLRYPVEKLQGFLAESLRHPVEPYGGRVLEDYRRFYRDYVHDYASFLLSEAITNGLEVPPIVNIHGFMNGGKTFPIGLSQLIEVIHAPGMISATDVYPGYIGEGNFHQLLMVNEITKALQNKEQPLFSVEFQAGGNNDFSGGQSSFYDLHTRLCISSGMRGINHYLFCDGENDPVLSPVKRHDWGHPVRRDGSLRNHYARYPRLSHVLASYGTDLTLSQPKTVTTIAFLLDDFMTEVNNRFSQEHTRILTHQRETILFDMIARGLALTHRPFDVFELAHSEFNPEATPLLWLMMEKQCDPAIQQKLVDYLNKGGRLILAGRMCVEDFDHNECTLLRDAIGIEQVNSGEPFVQNLISAFEHQDVPVSFLETYIGCFDVIFARTENREVTGFIKQVGAGKVMVFGASMTANTLGDLDIVHQMAMKMDCPPLFELSVWVDIRLSCGENGNFLFVSNYQDDPVRTTVKYLGEPLFGGNPLCLMARTGQILPLEWQVRPGVLIHYITAELSAVTEDGSTITLKTGQDEFYAEMTLSGYRCESAVTFCETSGMCRVKYHGYDGRIVLVKTEAKVMGEGK